MNVESKLYDNDLPKLQNWPMVNVDPVNKTRLLNICHLNKVDMASKRTYGHCAGGWTTLYT